MSINGRDGGDRHLRLAALLDGAADVDMVPARQAGIQCRDLRRQRLHDRGGLRAGHDVGLHRHRGPPVPAPDNGIFLAVIDGRDLAQRNGPPVRQRHLQRADRRQRHALLGGGPDQHVDEIDPAAHLGGGDAGYDRVQGQGQLLRAQAQEARLVLVDPDPDRARRLHPVVVDVLGTGGGPDLLSDLERDRAHLVRLRPAHPVLQRPSDRRAKFQRIDPPDNARELGRQRVLQLRLHALPLLQSLGDDHGLGEEVVGKLNVEGQIEPHGALSDIGAPVVHVLIALQELVHPRRDVPGCVDRRVLGQLQVDEQLGPVG